MYLFTHSIAEGGIHPLVAAHTRQTFELRRHDGGKEMPAVTFDLQRCALKAGGNEILNLLGGRV